MIHDDIISYNEVKHLSDRALPRNLLMGNGFSMALFPEIFSYDRLYAVAREVMSARLAALFDALATRDFERVMQLLQNGETILKAYFDDDGAAEDLRTDRLQLRQLLVETIAARHPDSRAAIDDARYERCWAFLSYFHNLYTLNYDLLLYWALMWKFEQLAHPQRREFQFKDAFYVWEDELLYYEKMNKQAVFYLHGAVHIIRQGHRLYKLNLTNDARALMQQVNDAIDQGNYPLFVSEATSAEKLDQIKKDGYLDAAYQRLRKSEGDLVIFGSSISEVDHHIWDAIQVSSIETVYVGTRGARGSARFQQLRDGIERELHQPRLHRDRRMEIYFFDAASVAIW